MAISGPQMNAFLHTLNEICSTFSNITVLLRGEISFFLQTFLRLLLDLSLGLPLTHLLHAQCVLANDSEVTSVYYAVCHMIPAINSGTLDTGAIATVSTFVMCCLTCP